MFLTFPIQLKNFEGFQSWEKVFLNFVGNRPWFAGLSTLEWCSSLLFWQTDNYLFHKSFTKVCKVFATYDILSDKVYKNTMKYPKAISLKILILT
jgi:hypothetical protein